LTTHNFRVVARDVGRQSGRGARLDRTERELNDAPAWIQSRERPGGEGARAQGRSANEALKAHEVVIEIDDERRRPINLRVKMGNISAASHDHMRCAALIDIDDVNGRARPLRAPFSPTA